MSSIIREALEENYNCPIKSKKFQEHYVSDKRKYYLLSVKLENGSFYFVESQWYKTYVCGFPLWFVVQESKIFHSQNKMKCFINYLKHDKGNENYYNYIGNDLNIRKTKIDITKAFNLVCGPILNNYKNYNLTYDEIVNNFYNHQIRFSFKECKFNSVRISISGLKTIELRWISNFIKNSNKYKKTLYIDYKENILSFSVNNYNFYNYGIFTEQNICKQAKEFIKRQKKSTLMDLATIVEIYGV